MQTDPYRANATDTEQPCSPNMVVLNFTLTPEAASKIHDLLVCLGKFSETVAIEARRERVGY